MQELSGNEITRDTTQNRCFRRYRPILATAVAGVEPTKLGWDHSTMDAID